MIALTIRLACREAEIQSLTLCQEQSQPGGLAISGKSLDLDCKMKKMSYKNKVLGQDLNVIPDIKEQADNLSGEGKARTED